MTRKIPQPVQKMISQYLNLKLDGKKVPCPYYINRKKLRMGLRVLIGKGTPEEIVQESLIYEKLRGVHFDNMTIQEIREFMVKRHIGIDCSGFVIHVLDIWLQAQNKKHLWDYLKLPKQNLYRKIASFLRPVENISAKTLTDNKNTYEINNLNNINCGDLIRTKGLKGGYHVMIITKVNKTKGKVNRFQYAHATRLYGKAHGVKQEQVIIKNADNLLSKQKWVDNSQGERWVYDEIKLDPKYSQVRRFKKVPLV